MIEVLIKIALIVGLIGAFFVSVVSNDVIHQSLFGLNILQGLTLKHLTYDQAYELQISSLCMLPLHCYILV